MYGKLKKAYKEHGARFLSVLASDRTRGNGQIGTQEVLSEHQEAFTMRVNKQPREVVKSLSLKILKKPSVPEKTALGGSA